MYIQEDVVLLKQSERAIIYKWMVANRGYFTFDSLYILWHKSSPGVSFSSSKHGLPGRKFKAALASVPLHTGHQS